MHLSNSSHIATCTRSGRKATLLATNCTRLKLILFLNNPCHIFQRGEGHNFFGPYKGEGYSFFCRKLWKGRKKIHLGKHIVPALPPSNKIVTGPLYVYVSRGVQSLVELQYAFVSLGMYGLWYLCTMLLTSFSVLFPLLYKVLQ